MDWIWTEISRLIDGFVSLIYFSEELSMDIILEISVDKLVHMDNGRLMETKFFLSITDSIHKHILNIRK